MGLFDNWNDPALAMAAGLLGAPSLGQGLSRGLLGGMQAERAGQEATWRQQALQQQMRAANTAEEMNRLKIAEAQREAANEAALREAAGRSQLPGGGFNLPGMISEVAKVNPLKAIQLQQAMAKETPFNKVDPKDYTPESLRAYQQSRDVSQLVPVRKVEVSNGVAFNPFETKPGTYLTNMNDQIIPDGKGGWQANPLLLQAKMAVANAGATRVQNNVNSYLPASEEAQRDFMKGFRTRYDQLQAAGPTLDNIEKAKELIPKAAGFVGSGAEAKLAAVKFLNNNLSLGINTEGVKNAEELQSRLFMGIMDNLKKMDSQPSQTQQAALQRALGQIGTDPSALPAVLDVFGDIVRQKVVVHNEEARGATTNGVRFPYDPTIKIPEKRGKGGAAGWSIKRVE